MLPGRESTLRCKPIIDENAIAFENCGFIEPVGNIVPISERRRDREKRSGRGLVKGEISLRHQCLIRERIFNDAMMGL